MKTSGQIDEEPLGRCYLATGGGICNTTVYTYYERETGKQGNTRREIVLEIILSFCLEHLRCTDDKVFGGN